ncbi:hypothetical protein COW98_01300 [Candidatus Roizmanbacteria bacterium CG22_combo_CG10-13_8_21_14_all_35_9]|uniref:Uncharacterized protein n=4 Tax=Candidatus Roizmaniibacteriota TaxID=1752723 RepID=A0A2M8F0Q6_9BACT|nr:MAG: hypothetical protein COX47_00480 [Candidatus Roizmanbacteria bacterium CG23_combo_of_CG06-09_8_20_14_all_35_49]PIP62942.1 MAG: hypothetical protein COW98_01300 [Candidatus Roizmanbacteria bacterium CG22_combo_CG10-13_8_21_14_all_35_9]PIY71341.1 MAG: hypothetical protein COY88_00835 [Candidatus Roizmanbacteria bacterium CG_4_10_14_0_8_um_filter_35_28]PJC32874.1 MAG: hypothetical protein CO048_04130 [Candidatus Roizmanbacteria bacterium CG_4_9_14_0_2_um_filter_35_15]PJC83163.1 MAG: hypoth
MAKNFTAIDDLVKKLKKENRAVSLHKEAEPVAAEKFEIKEVVEHKAEEEVRPYISPRQDTIELPPDLKKMGLQPTSSTQFSSYQNITLPIPDEKIVVGLHAPITSSIRWLATLAVYLLARVHLGLKVVHGKVIRVLRS